MCVAMKNSVLSTCGSLLLLLPLSLHAGFLKEWQVKETASAPVLVAGRILAVHRNERVPDDQLSWKAETWSMMADVEVLRAFNTSATASQMPLVSQQIRVHFLAYGPSLTAFVCCSPTPLPNIPPGEIRILPLQENSNPASEPWQLMADSGADITIPVRADAENEPAPPVSARAFLILEFANTLSRGTPGEVAALSGYLSRRWEDLSPELMPLLESGIGDNRQQWAEIAANLHAARGIPRPAVAELFAARPEDLAKPGPFQGNLPLLAAALRKLGRSSETDNLLIRTWIADAPFNAWGSANSLIEYAADPLTTETLRQSLRDGLSGASYLAYVLVNHGNKAILPDAVERAFRVVDDLASMGTSDMQGAAAMLRDHGSDQELTRLAAVVRKYQTLDPKYYNLLWQYATEADNPREARVLAVVLSDRRTVPGDDLRYCDYALGEVRRLRKQKADVRPTPMAERDQEIAQALESIRVQGALN
jgi:hypothetical protein